MRIERKELMNILNVLTYAVGRAGGKEIILIGGSALSFLERGRETRDVDVFVRDVNIATEQDIVEKWLQKACKQKGYHASEIRHSISGTTYFDITLDEKTIPVGVLSTLDKPVDLDEIINRLGAFTLTRMNDVEIRCPTYESVFMMKLQSMDYHRPRDLNDLKWLYNHINRDRVMSFCVEYNLIGRYKKIFKTDMKKPREEKGVKKKANNSYLDLYNLALRLSDRALRISLRRLHYSVPKSHEGKARLYARHYATKKKGENLKEFRYYLKWKGKKSR